MSKNLFQTLGLSTLLFGSGLAVALIAPVCHGYAQSQTQVCYTYSSSMGYCSINEIIPSTALDSSTTCLLEAGEITVDACERRAINYANQIGVNPPSTPCPEWVQDMTSVSSCPSPTS